MCRPTCSVKRHRGAQREREREREREKERDTHRRVGQVGDKRWLIIIVYQYWPAALRDRISWYTFFLEKKSAMKNTVYV